MAVVMQTKQQNRNTLGKDNTPTQGMGKSAKEIADHYRRSTQMYFDSSESLQNAESDFLLPVTPETYERFVRRSLRDSFNELERLRTWNTDWNSYDAPKPDPAAIEHAKSWLIQLFQSVKSLGWLKPNVTGGPEGSIVFEWWYGKRKLTVYIEAENVEYVQVWGTDVNAKITDGSIESTLDCQKLWMWLIG